MKLPPFLYGCFDWRVNGYHWAAEPDTDLLSDATLVSDNPFVVLAALVERAKHGDHGQAARAVPFFTRHEPFALARTALLVFADIATNNQLQHIEQALQCNDPIVRMYAAEAAELTGSLALVPAMLDAWIRAESLGDHETIGFALSHTLEDGYGPIADSVGAYDAPLPYRVGSSDASRRLHELMLARAADLADDPPPLPGLVAAEHARLSRLFGPNAIVWAGGELDMTRFVRHFLDEVKDSSPGVGHFIGLRHRFEAWTGERCDDFFHAFAPQRLDMAATLEDFLRTKAASYVPGQRYFFGHPIPAGDGA